MRITKRTYSVKHPKGSYDLELIVVDMPRRLREKVAVKKKGSK